MKTKPKAKPKTMSEADYARHRNLSRQRISGMKARGLLVMKGALVDVAASDAILDAEPTKGKETILESQQRKETALADLRELDLAKRRGLLMDSSKAREQTFEIFRGLRDAILTVPDRAVLGGDPESRRLRIAIATELRSTLEDYSSKLA